MYLTGRITYDWTLEEILPDYKNELEMIKKQIYQLWEYVQDIN